MNGLGFISTVDKFDNVSLTPHEFINTESCAEEMFLFVKLIY